MMKWSRISACALLCWFGAGCVVAGAWAIYRHLDKKINEELGG